MLVKRISIVDFKILFDDFAKEVRNKKYSKIEYNTWKRLNTFIKESLNSTNCLDNEIAITWSALHKKVWIKKDFSDESLNTGLFDFYDDDESFGAWLWLKLFSDIKYAFKNNGPMIKKKNSNGDWEDYSKSTTSNIVWASSLAVPSAEIECITPDWGNQSLYNWSRGSTKADIDADVRTTVETYTDINGFVRERVREEVSTVLNEMNINKKEEVNNMKGFNFDFGPVTSDVRMSIYGLAVKNASGTYVAYDKANKNIMDVDIFNFEGSKFLYKMPVAIKSIKAGDIVIHARKPMFVLNVNNDNTLRVVDPIGGEKKDVLLTKSPFGFDFATKVVNFLDSMGVNATPATEDNPFGNMWMLALLGDGKMDKDTLLPLMLMNQNGGNINPMMAFALMGDKGGNNDFLTMFALSGMMNGNGNGCGCNCHETKESANN